MKRLTLFLTFFLLLCWQLPVFSEPERFFIQSGGGVPVRKGMGTEHGIIDLLKDNEEVKIIDRKKEWSKVSFRQNQSGWVENRYLSNEVPAALKLPLLMKENKKLRKELETANNRLEALSGSSENKQQQLATCIAENKQIKEQYDKLVQDSGNIVTTIKKLKECQEVATVNEEEIIRLKEENKRLKNSFDLIWFISGAMVLAIGWIVGLITAKASKRRRSSLL